MSTATSGISALATVAPVPQTLVGVSQYSSDLQSVLNRAVSIAQIPLKQLQNSQSDAVSKKALLIGLNTYVDSLAQSIAKLGTVSAGKALSGQSSDSSSVSIANTGATAPGTWQITNLNSVATATSSRSTTFYATTDKTAVGSSGDGSMTIVAGSQRYDFKATNLKAICSAINGSGLPVAATIITPQSGQNYLSLVATNTGAVNVQLLDGPPPANGASDTRTDLLTTTAGTNVSFTLNGLAVNGRSSNVIADVIPGVTFTLLKAPASGSVTLSLNSDRSQLSTALSGFVNSYNALLGNVSQQVGQSAGMLSGDIAITSVQDDMRQLVSYQGSGTIRSLSDLGITMDSSGKMSFDPNAFGSLTDAQVSSAFTFLGSSGGGLAALAKNFTQLSDPISGMIRTEENGLDQTNTNLGRQINAMNDRITLMQQALQARLQQADALLAQLQSQQSMLTASLTSLNYVLYGKQLNQTG